MTVFDIKNIQLANTFIKSTQFAKETAETSHNNIHLIIQARKNLLCDEDVLLVKMDDKKSFGVPIGCFNGSEVCKLIKSYILK